MEDQFLKTLAVVFFAIVVIEVYFWMYGKVLENRRDKEIEEINAYFDDILEDLRKRKNEAPNLFNVEKVKVSDE